MWQNSKSQILNPKQISNSNFQNSKQINFGHWIFGHWCLFAIWCLVFGIFLMSCGKKAAEIKRAAIPVEVAPAQKIELEEILQFTGDIKGKDQVQVYSKVAGKLIEYKVEEGARVEKEDVIALIDRDVTGFKFEPAPVKAPLSGILAKTYLDNGDSVNPQVPIAVVADIDEVKVKIEITEVDYPKIKVGQGAEISLDAYPDKKFNGTLYKLSTLISPQTRTASAEIAIPNSEHLLVPGMFGRVRLSIRKHKALAIPYDAILRLPGTGVYYCFMVKENKAQKVFVELGIRKDNWQEIKKGLKEGDLVILSGQGILKTGLSVEIKKQHKVEK